MEIIASAAGRTSDLEARRGVVYGVRASRVIVVLRDGWLQFRQIGALVPVIPWPSGDYGVLISVVNVLHQRGSHFFAERLQFVS